jgi:hypothetical protein
VIRKTSKEEAAGAGDTRTSKAVKATTAKEEAATLDQNGCPPLSAKGRASKRGKATARGRSTGKCETADAKVVRDSKTDSATLEPNICPPLTARGKAGARGKAARGRSAGKCETADTNDTRKSREALALDKNGCPVLPAKGKAGTRGKSGSVTSTRGKTTARGKASNKCETADARDAKGAKADATTKGEPARIWVQVAGGANEGTLEKAWAAVKAKAPDLFRNRQGWSTPLRATNRVLTGPFKSTEEAQAFVNQLSKAGLSGFVFSSTKGQKVDRLGGK